jgi:hypothetical protein
MDIMKNIWGNQLSSVLNHARYEMINPDKVYTEVGEDFWYNDLSILRLVEDGGTMPRLANSDPNTNQRVSDR